MAAPSTLHYQPLLGTNDQSPTKKSTSSSRKTLYVFLSFVAIISPTAFVALHFINPNLYHPSSSSSSSDLASSLVPTHLCDRAHNPTSCLAMITEAVNGEEERLGRLSDSHFLQIFLEKSVPRISNAMEVFNGFNGRSNDLKEKAALANCVKLMDLSIDRVTDSVMALKTQSTRSHADAHVWLSAVLTNHVTCLDGLSESSRLNEWTRLAVEMEMEDLIARARTSLAMIVAISPPSSDHDDDGEELATWSMRKMITDRYPSWVTMRDRKLLEALPNDIIANVTVAKDGSGNYTTVQEAVSSAPDKSKTRYVIYVKNGTYEENVEVGKKKKNVMMVGDGMNLTIITGSLNYIDGSTTWDSATVAVDGDGFIAQDICFQNTAGAVKEQAVAIRVNADKVAINRCKMDAYQDTLYAHSQRSFYVDCSITGTVDFIFGNAAMVIQNSTIIAREPLKGQSNMITASGRTDSNQNTGISIQNCDVIASSDLSNTTKTYLGRPWKLYARTVFMQSFLGDLIEPEGWSEWNGDYALDTLYYGEYDNWGPGSNTSNRVTWTGYHVITDPAVAENFTVAELIQGEDWLNSTGVPYTPGLF
ncbi:Pectinesterase [Macleaya cordata]|uniref:Pectinesterase n=1 Tax=Macleaya cordata TaxID=56857 RepID=A0A200QRS2_MACCD|nr:Pectinesterase [Macleaya cordata]